MKHKIYKDEKILGSYLAGLWKGDGYIVINKKGGDRLSYNF